MPSRRRRRFMLRLAIAAVVSTQIEMSWADQAVSCKSAAKWMNNENGHSPCTVALYLMLQCSEDLVILPLNSSVRSYENPLQGQQCTCNTVVYNLMSACAVCQDGSPTDFDTWSSGCSNITDGYPNSAIAQSYSTPQWAYTNLTSRRTFNLAAVEEVAGVDKGWSPVQIAVPVIVGIGVALIVGLIFFFYRRHLKQRYTPIGGTYPSAPAHIYQDSRIYSQRSLPQSRPGHQQVASSSSLALNSLYGRNSPVPTRKKSRAAVAWENARMNAPRKLGGLLPDRRKVHERTRGADWSIDDPIDEYGHSKAVSSSSSGSGAGMHSKEASGDNHNQLRTGVTGRGSRPSNHSRSESRLGLLSEDSPERLNPIQDSPDLIREQPTSSFVQGLVNGLSRIGRRQRPVPVQSRPPRRGFKVDDVDSASSPTVLQNVRESRYESLMHPGAGVNGDIEADPGTDSHTMPSGARTSLNAVATNGAPSSQNPSQSGSSGSGGSRPCSDVVPDINLNDSSNGNGSGEVKEDERRGAGVVLISRSPGQDFNSMAASSPVNTEETSGFGSFAATTENDSWPAALTDISSVVGQTHHHAPIPIAPPPTVQTLSTSYSPSHSPSGTPRPPSRILIPPGNSISQLLVPPAIRAAGGYTTKPTPPQSHPPSSFSPQQALTSAGTLPPNARLFSGTFTESIAHEPQSAISAGGLTNEAGVAPASEHSSEAYTVPNPFVFDERRGGSVGAANALRMASPPRSRSRAEIIE